MSTSSCVSTPSGAWHPLHETLLTQLQMLEPSRRTLSSPVLLQEGERLRLGGCHRADLLGDLLSRNDLRGVFSHGTQRIIEKAKQTGIATMATRNHGSPMAFSAPAGEESSPVLDFGAKMDLSPIGIARRSMLLHQDWCCVVLGWAKSVSPGVACCAVCQ